MNFVTQEEAAFNRALVTLYASEPDLHRLPRAVFDCIAVAMPVQMISYGEFHVASNDFRVAFSQADPDPQRRAETLAAYQRHAASHPFWQYDPAFYDARALRESDFFDDEEFFALPIAKEVFLPSNAHRQMRVVVGFDGYVLHVTAHRIVGEPPFSDAERDRMQVLRGHIVRIYRQAVERTAILAERIIAGQPRYRKWDPWMNLCTARVLAGDQRQLRPELSFAGDRRGSNTASSEWAHERQPISSCYAGTADRKARVSATTRS